MRIHNVQLVCLWWPFCPFALFPTFFTGMSDVYKCVRKCNVHTLCSILVMHQTDQSIRLASDWSAYRCIIILPWVFHARCQEMVIANCAGFTGLGGLGSFNPDCFPLKIKNNYTFVSGFNGPPGSNKRGWSLMVKYQPMYIFPLRKNVSL